MRNFKRAKPGATGYTVVHGEVNDGDFVCPCNGELLQITFYKEGTIVSSVIVEVEKEENVETHRIILKNEVTMMRDDVLVEAGDVVRVKSVSEDYEALYSMVYRLELDSTS